LSTSDGAEGRRRADDDPELADNLALDEELADPADQAARPEAGQPSAPQPSGPAADEDDSEAAGAPPTRRERRRQRRADRRKRKAPWWELPLLVALAVAIAVLVKSFLVQPFYIPSESMEKTLHGCRGCSGDRILVNKVIYDFRDPSPGDITVFDAPPGWARDEPVPTPPSNPVLRVLRGFGQLIGFVPPDDLVLVKRVIAVGGETIRGTSVNGGRSERIQVSDHGSKGPWRTLHEPYVDIDYPDASATFGPVTVPKGRLWVMGDHRNASADSRYHCGPGGTDGNRSSCDPYSSTVPVKNVIGKAFVIAWPPSRWRTLGTPGTFTAAGASLGVGVLMVRRRRRR
jgi:signal peptidase I